MTALVALASRRPNGRWWGNIATVVDTRRSNKNPVCVADCGHDHDYQDEAENCAKTLLSQSDPDKLIAAFNDKALAAIEAKKSSIATAIVAANDFLSGEITDKEAEDKIRRIQRG
jgi:hypothetical protein